MCDSTKSITGNHLNPSRGSIAVIGNVTVSENILQSLERWFRALNASQKKFAAWCKTPEGTIPKVFIIGIWIMFSFAFLFEYADTHNLRNVCPFFWLAFLLLKLWGQGSSLPVRGPTRTRAATRAAPTDADRGPFINQGLLHHKRR